MLDERQVKNLSKEDKRQLDKLLEEYDVTLKGIRTRKVHGYSKEAGIIHHVASKNLADFVSRHRLAKK